MIAKIDGFSTQGFQIPQERNPMNIEENLYFLTQVEWEKILFENCSKFFNFKILKLK